MNTLAGAALGQSYSLWKAAHGGAGGLEDLPPMGTRAEHCLRDRSCGTEPCWSSAWRAAVCGKAMQDQVRKDSIP